MERKNFRIIDSSGNWVASPTITVYLTGTTTIASIFDDEGFTAKANPFVGPSTGLVYFYAADGKYDVVVSGGTPTVSYTLASNLLDDTLSLSSGGGGISTINALSAATQLLTTSTTGTDFTISSVTDTHTFRLPVASSTSTGKLSSADWTTFNSKIGSLNGLTVATQTLAIGSSGTTPTWSSSGSVHTLNLPTASASNTGKLSSADWTIFNAKQNALTVGTSAQYVRGDLTNQTLNTTVVPEGSNLYYTDVRVRAAISATSPIAFSGAGVISIQQSSGSLSGYLSSSDWTTFNNKLSSLTTDATGTDFSSSTAAGAVTVHLPAASPSNTGGKVTNATQSFSGNKTWYGVHITAASRRRYVTVHTAPANVTVAQDLQDIIAINKTVAGATTVTLPASPTTGDEITIKDDKGDAAGNNITISGNGKNIDTAATLVLNTNYASATIVYNGTKWNRIASV